jgi:ribosomal protein L37AE/L43A
MRSLGAAAVLVVAAAAAVAICLRSMRTDVDHSVAQIRENHACPFCGHAFLLAVAEAAAMRRAHGDIVCPKCGRAGAMKEVSASAGALVNERASQPPDSEEPGEDEEEGIAPRKKPAAPTPSLTKPRPP